MNGFGAFQGGREGRSLPCSGLRPSRDGRHAAGYSEVAFDDDPGSYGTPYLGQLPHAGLPSSMPVEHERGAVEG
jgi:hypothetical protein